MPIVTSNPATLTYPEIPFDRLGVHLSIAPTWQPKDVSGTLSLYVIPYRQLPDGTVEKRDDLARSLSVGDIFEESARNPAFAQAMQTVWGAVQTYILAAGL